MGGNHDTMKDSISSLISSHKPGKTPWGGNHDTTRDSISSLISSHKPGKIPHDTMGWTPQGGMFHIKLHIFINISINS